jgi:TolB protein
MINNHLKTLLLYFTLSITSATSASAIVYIDINKGNIQPQPIAINNFLGTQAEAMDLGTDISRVLSHDLERSGLFRPIDHAAFIEHLKGSHVVPKFSSWRQINANHVVSGGVSIKANHEIEVEFRLWDIYSEQQIAAYSHTIAEKEWRRVAHRIADQIYKRLTGEEGYFDTQITYIAESGPTLKRIRKLAVMDQDGENHRFLTDGRNLVLTPRFSPSSKQISYLSYANRKPRVYIMEKDTGRERALGDFPGMSFAPRFSNGGNVALISVAERGATNIYRLALSNLHKTKLTNNSAINTSPSYSPDDKKIVFNSDRGGSGQLYMMNADGSDQRRISFGKGTYSAPSWSPRGDLIAFTKSSRGTFYIGVMRPDGSGERVITQGYLVEGPCWSPNGRVILFTKAGPSSKTRAARSKLHSIDLTGHNERELVTPMDASDPAWSQLLP